MPAKLTKRQLERLATLRREGEEIAARKDAVPPWKSIDEMMKFGRKFDRFLHSLTRRKH